jgi:hypothetical protein
VTRPTICVALLCIASACSVSPSQAKPTKPPSATSISPAELSFEERSLDERWRGEFASFERIEGSGSPAVEAWILGAWWAIIDSCRKASKDMCATDGADYLYQTVGRDPRDIDHCDWARTGAIAGTVQDAYASTSKYLDSTTGDVPFVPELFSSYEAYGGGSCER